MRSSPGTSSICSDSVQIGCISTRTSTTLAQNTLLAFNLNTDVVCVFLGKDGAENIGEDEAIYLRAHIELYWQEVEWFL